MVNKVILIGNVGKDPDVRYLEGNVPVARFPLATSETYRNRDGEKVTQTEWHNIVIWRGLAKVVEDYVKKGQALYIEGKIKTRSFDDKSGNKRYITEIVADNMQMLGKRSAGAGANTTTSENKTPSDESSESLDNGSAVEDDLPF